jgi:hypothetical protein
MIGPHNHNYALWVREVQYRQVKGEVVRLSCGLDRSIVGGINALAAPLAAPPFKAAAA